jgi:hypothetical protein
MLALRRWSLVAGVVLAFAMALPAQGASSTLYITPSGNDANPCTQTQPCKSFSRAYQASQPGGEVLISAGTYPSQTFANLPRKASNDYVTFRPVAGATVTIGYLSTSNSHNIEVRDIRTGGWGVTNGATHVIYRNLTANDLTQAAGYFSGSTDVQILGGEIARIDPNDGIHMNAGGGQNTNILIDGLYMHDLTRNTDPASHNDCIQTGSAINLTIRNSRFINCGTQGVFLNPYGAGQARDITLENNWFGPAQLGYNSLYVGDAVGVTVRNNSFTQQAFIWSSASQTTMVGNILVGTDAYTCSVIAGRAKTFSHNLTTGTCSGASNHTVDANLRSQYVNPDSGVAGNLDLHLKAGATAIDRGLATNAPATDFDGSPRPNGAGPDAGADETGSGPTPTPTPSPTPTPKPSPTPTPTPSPTPTPPKPGPSPAPVDLPPAAQNPGPAPAPPSSPAPPAGGPLDAAHLDATKVCSRATRRCRRTVANVVVRLSRASRVTVRIERSGATAAKARTVRTVRVDGTVGENQIALPVRRLAPGRYWISVHATDGGAPQRLRLVVR